MNPVNNVDSNSDINTLNPAQMSQQDFISAIYLERSEMLDSEVRRIIGDIDKSNQYIDIVNKMIGKANISEYGSNYYDKVSWKVSNNQVILDSGYALKIQPDGNGGSSFTVSDKDGNQLMYQNQTLIPIPKDTTVDALNVGIPVMNDMTFSLEDGTEITLKVDEPATAFNQKDFSGGLANVTSIFITRNNQGMAIENLNSASPAIKAPTVDVAVTNHSLTENYRESSDFGKLQEHSDKFFNQLREKTANLPIEQEEALRKKFMAEGLKLDWSVWDTSDVTVSQHKSSPVYPMQAGESLEAFLLRASQTSRKYVDSWIKGVENDGSINITGVTLITQLPAFTSTDSTRPDVSHHLDNNNNDGHVLFESGGVHSWEYGGKAIYNLSLPTTKNIGDISHAYGKDYQGSSNYENLTEHSREFFSEFRSKIFANNSPEKEAALKNKFMTDGLELYWVVNGGEQIMHRYKLSPDESVDSFLTRAQENSAQTIRTTIEQAASSLNSVSLGADMTAYSYQLQAGPQDKSNVFFENSGQNINNLTVTIKPSTGGDTAIKHSLIENYQESTDYGKLQEHSDKFFNQLREQVIGKLSPAQQETLRQKLLTEGLKLNWSVWETSDISPSRHQTAPIYRLESGESINAFLTRASTTSKQFVDAWIKKVEPYDINITGVTLETTLPDISSANANKTGDSQTVTGYFARKLAMQNNIGFEKTGSAPILNNKEIELLNNILKIPYADASGVGQLTPSEWTALKTSLINSRDHLTSNSQLQTVQLQRAMQTYNQNFEAMSNTQQKIYSLLRDILSNLK